VPPGELGVSRQGGADQAVNGEVVAFPDSLVGTDSHTTMINALGVLGWGVGGIEAEAVMLGQPYLRCSSRRWWASNSRAPCPRARQQPTSCLTVTQLLRKKGVVGKFVEFYGDGLAQPDARRPRDDCEHGARVRRDDGLLPRRPARRWSTCEFTGSHESLVRLVEAYCQGEGAVPRTRRPDPEYSDTLELDLGDNRAVACGPGARMTACALSVTMRASSSEQGAVYDGRREGGSGLQPPEPSRWAR
jgi:aconitate hydratase